VNAARIKDVARRREHDDGAFPVGFPRAMDVA
jgi:hypothetical protein